MSSEWNFSRQVTDVPPREASLSGDEQEETSVVGRLLFLSYPLDGELSTGQCYPTFEQPGTREVHILLTPIMIRC